MASPTTEGPQQEGVDAEKLLELTEAELSAVGRQNRMMQLVMKEQRETIAQLQDQLAVKVEKGGKSG